MFATPSPDLPLSNNFLLPTNKDVGATRRSDSDSACVYFCGNSLGALSQKSKDLIKQELHVWEKRAVVGHFSHPHHKGWVSLVDLLTPILAEIVGAKEKEVACMGTLTNNLHLMMDSFYKPTTTRFKILCEARAFPSDQYAFASQARAHGLDPATAVLEISPRDGEFCLREEDILDVIEKEGCSIALVLFSSIQYYTGQWFPMEKITRKAKEQGCICGWDLAHGVGNVPLSLHDWDVDFAVFCTYKYLNSGPGGIAGLFMHEKWNDIQSPRFAGWWGHDPVTRFDMPPTFSPIVGAQGFQQSNPPAFSLAALLGSLYVFKEAGLMHPLRERSIKLTGFLESRLIQSKYFVPLESVISSKSTTPTFTIITPKEIASRGSQLSLLFLPVGSGTMQKVFDGLVTYGVIGDEREPDVIRLAPMPLYSTFKDCNDAVMYLDKVLEELQ